MEDTIAAVATAYGEGGIGIIRLSGPETLDIMSGIFQPARKESSFAQENRKLIYGTIVDPSTNKTIDEVLAVYMKAPYTYTREDVGEIHCHGSIISLRKTLELILSRGARLAEKGEFTKRAFLNGRLDLSQAEAVMDLIKADTDKGFDVALEQMEGSLSAKVRELRDSLVALLAHVAVNIDYPDEDIEEITYEEMIKSISVIGDEVGNMLARAHTGRIIREGLKVTIAGKPNVGKSSLMNAMLRETRAIVTDIPGTTRDTIEEGLSVRGIPLRLTDTAGIHSTEDQVEKLGIEKSKESFNKADLILFILDGSKALEEEDLELMEKVLEKPVVVLVNKTDLDLKLDIEEVKAKIPHATVIKTAVKEGTGLDLLEEEIERLVYSGGASQKDSLLVTNVRHKNALEQTASALNDAKDGCERREALDLVEIDLRRAWEFLGEITGETAAEDIIDQVFSRFCLGK